MITKEQIQEALLKSAKREKTKEGVKMELLFSDAADAILALIKQDQTDPELTSDEQLKAIYFKLFDQIWDRQIRVRAKTKMGYIRALRIFDLKDLCFS